MVVDPIGKVLVEAGEGEEIVYADIGEWCKTVPNMFLTLCRRADDGGDEKRDSCDDAAAV
jgi:hypothetical protein